MNARQVLYPPSYILSPTLFSKIAFSWSKPRSLIHTLSEVCRVWSTNQNCVKRDLLTSSLDMNGIFKIT